MTVRNMGQGPLKPSRNQHKPNSRSFDKSNERIPRLYLNISDQAWPLVYSSGYNVSFGGMEKLHPFDAGKWGRVHQMLIDKKMLLPGEFVEPLEASEEELQKVHSQKYLNSLKWSANVAMITEVPPVAMLPNYFVQRSVLRPFRLQTGGSILAGKLAMERGWAINIGGGFHHCSAERGGGFCAYADITLNIRYLWENFPDINKVLIVDLDAHQGNGYAHDFMGEERVFIFDVYNRLIYPNDQRAKLAISRPVELVHGTSDSKYLELVRKNLPEVIELFNPEYIVYNAGTDILSGDPLGCLDISPNGIVERDQIVFEAAHRNKIPIVMFTSGGYQRSTAAIIADSIFNLNSHGFITGPKNILHSE
uniref:histone deacetylase 11-like n=1 Tax=Styela clava TaxID=7725 RepID=UPI00193A2819|nr:histone deacetylase 11-like [Styela clava]